MVVFDGKVIVATVDIILDAPLRDPLRARAAMQHFNSYLDDYEKRLRAVSRGKSVAALSTEFSVEYLRVAITGTSHRHAAQTFLESIKELRVNLNREVFRVWETRRTVRHKSTTFSPQSLSTIRNLDHG